MKFPKPGPPSASWIFPLLLAALLASPACRVHHRQSTSSAQPLALVFQGNSHSGQWEYPGDLRGDFTARQDGTWLPVRIQRHGSRSTYNTGIHAADIEIQNWEPGTTATSPIRMILRRDAGQLILNGRQAEGSAAGDFKFEANLEFAHKLASFTLGKPDEAQLWTLFISDFGLSTLEAWKGLNAKIALEDFMRCVNHGVTAAYFSQFRSIYSDLAVSDLLQLRNHGVPPDFAQSLHQAEFDFTPDDLIRLRQFGVSEDYALQFKEAGLEVSADRLVRFRQFGVKPEFAAKVKQSGLGEETDEIIKLRNHGVSESFLEVVASAERRYSIDETIRLRNHGVSGDFLEGAQKAGYSLTADELILLRNHGVSLEYLREIRVPGKKPPAVEAIVHFRQRGVSAEMVRKLREN